MGITKSPAPRANQAGRRAKRSQIWRGISRIKYPRVRDRHSPHNFDRLGRPESEQIEQMYGFVN